MPQFLVTVPFDPVVHETLDSRVFTELPDTELSVGIRIRRGKDAYGAELEVEADRPGMAKATAIHQVERLLSVLASWNHGFQIRIGGVRSQVLKSDGTASASEVHPGFVEVAASETLFTESHVQAVVKRANLDVEDGLLRRYDDLPEYVRSCLDLNYLLVLSTRPPNRWMLAASGLEALANGTIGAQETASGRISLDQRRELEAEIHLMVDAIGIGDIGERVFQRVLSTTVSPVADHVNAYLVSLGIENAPPHEISRWWRVRGTIAHGGSSEIESGELAHLVAVFQAALRRSAGAEPMPSGNS